MKTEENRKADLHRFRSRVPAREPGEGDGIDPKYEARKREFQQGQDKPDHAARRLGRQMQQALSTGDFWPALPELESFIITEVRKAGPGNTYILILCCSDPECSYDPGDIIHTLKQHKGLLRQEIARSINRKRVPELLFEVLPPGIQA